MSVVHNVAWAVGGQQDRADPTEAFKASMRRLAATVTIVTTGQGPSRRGFTATAVCSVSMMPPRLLVCVNQSAEAHPLILQHASFCVNLLGESQRSLAESFAAVDGSKGVARFGDGEWMELATGAPALSTALACIDCSLFQAIESGTHTIVIGDVRGVHLNATEAPLLYYDRQFRKLAS